MPEFITLSETSLQRLAQLLRSDAYRPPPGPSIPRGEEAKSGARIRRIGRTTTNDDHPTYPATGNTFLVELGKPSFSPVTPGNRTLFFTPYDPPQYRIARDVGNLYRSDGTLVSLALNHGQWFIDGPADVWFRWLGRAYNDDRIDLIAEEPASLPFEGVESGAVFGSAVHGGFRRAGGGSDWHWVAYFELDNSFANNIHHWLECEIPSYYRIAYGCEINLTSPHAEDNTMTIAWQFRTSDAVAWRNVDDWNNERPHGGRIFVRGHRRLDLTLTNSFIFQCNSGFQLRALGTSGTSEYSGDYGSNVDRWWVEIQEIPPTTLALVASP